MARLNFCAGLGLFAILSACILMVFVEISQISARQRVPRVLRMTTIDTTNFGPALAGTGVSTTDLYGIGQRTGDGQGLRQFYEFGLWAHCSAASQGTTTDAYCTGTSWGREFRPAETILADVPSAIQSQVASALPSNVFTSSAYLGRFTRASFYLYFIGAILAGVSLFTGFLAHRFAFLFSALSGFLAFLALGVAATIWTILIHRVRNSLAGATLGGAALGITASYGNALWISWAAAGAALIAFVPFCLACCFGRSSRNYEYDDEKY